jgi:hypothetical protein
MAAGDDGAGGAWLVLVYQLPAKSAGLKSLVHRRLTAAGAVYLSRACVVAPAGPAERAMRRIRAIIADAGGTAVLLRAAALGGGEQLIAALEEARDREYDEIIAGCREGLTVVGALIEARDFRYAELSEGDTRLKRLDARYRAVESRGTPWAEPAGPQAGAGVAGAGVAVAGAVAGKAREAASALAGYRSALDVYGSGVYATDSAS